MNISLKSLLYKMGILLLLILLVVIYDYFTDSPRTKNSKAQAPTINYFASDIHTVQYTEKGSIDYKMTAEKLDHVELTDISYLTNPTAHLYKEAANPWFISSDKGEVGSQGKTVKLIDNIKGTQVDENGKTNAFEIGQTRNQADPIKYGEVMIYPNKKYAESKDYTVITSADGTTSGVGVKAYFETNKIQLLSNVKTQIIRGQNAN